MYKHNICFTNAPKILISQVILRSNSGRQKEEHQWVFFLDLNDATAGTSGSVGRQKKPTS